jgi:hypothetical protein
MEILVVTSNRVCTQEDQCTQYLVEGSGRVGEGRGSYDAWQGSRASAVTRECGCGSFTTTILCSACFLHLHPLDCTSSKLHQLNRSLLHTPPERIAQQHTRSCALNELRITTPHQLVADRSPLCRKDEWHKAGSGRRDAGAVHGR